MKVEQPFILIFKHNLIDGISKCMAVTGEGHRWETGVPYLHASI